MEANRQSEDNRSPQNDHRDEQEAHSEEARASGRAGQGRSFGSLFSSLTHDATALIQQEVRLAKAEGSEKVTQAVAGLAFIAIAAAVCLAGLIILLQAAVYGLNIWLPNDLTPWLSALIVGGIVVVIGLIMLLKGRNNLQANNLTPDKTVRSIKRDRDFVRKQPS